VIFWHKNIGAKGRRKMLMKLTPKENIEEVVLKVTAKNIFHFILDLVNSIFLVTYCYRHILIEPWSRGLKTCSSMTPDSPD